MIRIEIKKDTKVLEALKRNLNSSLKTELQVGFFPEAVYPDGTQVAQVAAWNNEGSLTNPARPFFTSSVVAPLERKKYKAFFDESISRIISGKSSFQKEYALIGASLQTVIMKSIVDWSSPPNSPATIADKGKDDPLRDSDLMLNSVDFKIVKRGS